MNGGECKWERLTSTLWHSFSKPEIGTERGKHQKRERLNRNKVPLPKPFQSDRQTNKEDGREEVFTGQILNLQV